MPIAVNVGVRMRHPIRMRMFMRMHGAGSRRIGVGMVMGLAFMSMLIGR